MVGTTEWRGQWRFNEAWKEGVFVGSGRHSGRRVRKGDNRGELNTKTTVSSRLPSGEVRGSAHFISPAQV